MAKVTLHIQGMSCGHCLNAVNRALHDVPQAVVQSVTMGRAQVEVPAAYETAALVKAIEAAGYHATAVVEE